MKLKPVTRDEFVSAFNAAWIEIYEGERKNRLDILYDEKSDWNAIMFGESPKELDGTSLLERAISKLRADRGVSFDRERQKVDVFGRIKVCDFDDHAAYANAIMIEVENNTSTCYEEFWKLLHSRCPLKVLITYDLVNPKDLVRARARIAEMFQKASRVLGSDDLESYLLIVGKWAKESLEIRWSFEQITSDGRFIELPTP